MGNLSQTDKHSPVVQTGQPNPEQSPKPLTPPVQHDPHPLKKEIQSQQQEEQRKTGSR